MKKNRGINLFCLIFSVWLTGGSTVEFQSNPKNLVAKVGSSLSFEYKISESKQLLLQKEGETRFIYQDFQIHSPYDDTWRCDINNQNSPSDKYNFTITNIKTGDGMKVQAQIFVSPFRTVYHDITVYDKDPTISRGSNSKLKIGQTFILKCEFERWGNGSFSAKFYQENTTLTSSSAIEEMTEGGNKIIFTGNFTATYQMDRKLTHCRIKSDDDDDLEIRSGTVTFEVEHGVEDVKISPEPQSDLSIKVGTSINCTASGNPDPTFEWIRNNEVLYRTASFTLDKSWAGKTHTLVCAVKNSFIQKNETITFRAVDGGTNSGGGKSGIESWKIAVATVGGILGLALIIGIIVILIVLRRKKQQPKPPIRSDSSRSPTNANDDPPIQRKPDNRVPADIPRSVGPTMGPPDSTPLYSEVQRPRQSAYDNIPPSAYQQPPSNRPGSREPFQQGEFDDSLASSNGPQDHNQSPKYILQTGPKPQAARPPRPISGGYPPRPSYSNYPPDTQV